MCLTNSYLKVSQIGISLFFQEFPPGEYKILRDDEAEVHHKKAGNDSLYFTENRPRQINKYQERFGNHVLSFLSFRFFKW
jgi:hypothetical protein